MPHQQVCIASSRPIGATCLSWAQGHLPDGFSLVDDPEQSSVFISVMYGNLVSEAFISGRRCYNFHPGILPEYRGSGAFSWAIINGEKECGITLHELDVNIDTGPVIACKRFPIEGWDTAGTLYRKGMEAMAELFKVYFHRILHGDYLSTPQDESKARTYYRKDLKKAQDLTRFVRAFDFEGKDPAYYTTKSGSIREVIW